jgi:transposase-like protein
MPAPSEPHPLRALLVEQGRTVAWLAGRLGCGRRLLYDRLSGRRPGDGSRGPTAWTPAPVKVVQVARELGVPSKDLADWLGVEMDATA